MALLGSEPVSAANLAAALGIGSGGGSLPSDFGRRPISVDNLKAVLESMGKPFDGPHVLFFSTYGEMSGTLLDPIENYRRYAVLTNDSPIFLTDVNDYGPVVNAAYTIRGTSFTTMVREGISCIIGFQD